VNEKKQISLERLSINMLIEIERFRSKVNEPIDRDPPYWIENPFNSSYTPPVIDKVMLEVEEYNCI